MPRHQNSPSQTWRTFLENHVQDLVSIDFFTVPTLRFQILYSGDTVDRAVQWLNAQSGKPYLLWVHLYDPHMPYKPPSPFKEKYKGSLYDGEIAYTDQQVGRLLDAVGKKAPTDKTIIAVLSDHGESLSENGRSDKFYNDQTFL